MSKDKVIDRIKKLLELSNSQNEHEAALAAAQAAKLQLDHQIAEAELENDVGEPEPITEECVGEDGKRVTWKLTLIGGLAESFGCKYYFVPGSHRGAKSRYYLIGPKSAIDTVRYMYGYLVNEVARLANKGYLAECNECDDSGVSRPSARAWKGSFRVGCATRIFERLAIQRKQTLNQARQDNRRKALMVIDHQKQAIERFTKEKHPNLRKMASYAGSGSRSGLAAGRSAGGRISLGGGRGELGTGSRRLRK